MKLQVNNSGAWKNVITFSVERVDQVKEHVAALALIGEEAEYSTSWRILDGQDRVVLHWSAPKGWHTPLFAAKYVWVP